MSVTLIQKVERMAQDQIVRLREQIGSKSEAWSTKSSTHVLDGVEVEVEVRVRVRSTELGKVSDPV